MFKKLKYVFLILIFVALLAGARILFQYISWDDISGFIKSAGVWAPLLYGTIYAVATVFAVPGAALTLIAGSIFGTVVGVIMVSISSTIGASLAFLVSRYIARKKIEQLLSGNNKLKKLDEMTEKHGEIIIAITRLVPLFPFNLLNYGFGLTKVRFGVYVFWSWLCMLPGTVLYVAGGDALREFITEGRINPVIIAVIAIMFLIITVLSIKIKKTLGAKNQKGDTK